MNPVFGLYLAALLYGALLALLCRLTVRQGRTEDVQRRRISRLDADNRALRRERDWQAGQIAEMEPDARATRERRQKDRERKRRAG